VHKGRVIAFAFAAFALVCGVVSLDYARGRVPETASPLILDVLSGGADKQCRRDVTAEAARHIPPGMARAGALKVINEASITLPRPWFWTPGLTQRLVDEPERVQATRSLRATAFGNELLLLDIGLRQDRVVTLAAHVECAFR
jgi:hypothetical protein